MGVTAFLLPFHPSSPQPVKSLTLSLLPYDSALSLPLLPYSSGPGPTLSPWTLIPSSSPTSQFPGFPLPSIPAGPRS